MALESVIPGLLAVAAIALATLRAMGAKPKPVPVIVRTMRSR